MFWNVSGIILGIALVTTFAVQIVCRILAIPISIPVSLINALIVCYLIITNKKHTKKVLRFTMLCMFLAALLGLIQVTFFQAILGSLTSCKSQRAFIDFKKQYTMVKVRKFTLFLLCLCSKPQAAAKHKALVFACRTCRKNRLPYRMYESRFFMLL